MNVDALDEMSGDQKNYFKYVHSQSSFPNEEVELVSSKSEKYPWLEFYDKDDIKAVIVDKKTGKPIQFNGKYVHTSIMLPTMESSTGKERFSGLEGVEESFIQKRIEEFEALREQAKEGNIRLPIEGRSMLFPNYQGEKVRLGVTERDTQEKAIS